MWLFKLNTYTSKSGTVKFMYMHRNITVACEKKKVQNVSRIISRSVSVDEWYMNVIVIFGPCPQDPFITCYANIPKSDKQTRK